MTVRPSVPAFDQATVPGSLPTGPTGVPVPAANAEAFLSMLLAALPSTEVPVPATEDGAATEGAAGDSALLSTESTETTETTGATRKNQASGATGATGEAGADPADTQHSGPVPTTGAPVPTPLEILDALAVGLPTGLRAVVGSSPQDAPVVSIPATTEGSTEAPPLPASAGPVGAGPVGASPDGAGPDGALPGEGPSPQTQQPPRTPQTPSGLPQTPPSASLAAQPVPAQSVAQPLAESPAQQAPVDPPAAHAASVEPVESSADQAGQPVQAVQTAQTGGPTTDAQTAPAPAASSTPAAAPVTAPVAAPAVAPAPAEPGATPHVTRQVFPEVSRLVTRGDGTHKLTLTLAPAALGDVQVTLTVRAGAVTVTFAAADQAQAALLEGAPELRRLLEGVGAQETRVLVRDIATPHTTGTTGTAGTPSDPTAGDPQDRTGSGPDTGSQGHEAPTHEHARTRADQFATDGSTRGPGSSRPAHDPDTRRPGGVDVTV